MRKPEDDVIARGTAEHRVGNALQAEGLVSGEDLSPVDAGRALLAGFARAVEFEKVASKAAGSVVYLRRLVITGEWEVDPDGGK